MIDKEITTPQLASEEFCTGCLACVDVCKRDALKVVEKYNHLYPSVDTNVCIGCGACEKICPIVSPIPNIFDSNKAKVVAAWSKDDNIRLNAASGGFCTAMSLDTIREGGKVALCTWKNGKAFFILTDKPQEIIEAANSKYVHSNALEIYRKVKESLDLGGKVLFVGLPCQVAGIKGFLRKKDYGEKLKTIELICSAPPSVEAIKLQETIANQGSLIRFRTKTAEYKWGYDYNLQLCQDGNKTVVEQGNVRAIFYKIFASMLTARYSCLHCQFAKIERVADYTVGDFHGYRTKQWDKGISLVICKDESSYDNLKLIESLEFENSTISKAISSNPRLYTGWDALRYHPANVFRGLFSKMPTHFRFNMLVNKYPYRIIWMMFKLFTKINNRIKRKMVLKKI
ncbi:MAG: Coenzyme F420 hydrogenase/dehydrogenase, beta subunit C-terminal domain [Paludibacteraceae bacterium]|nr:Coenzyme F420 hydrogenase/dehydrogenase, beta subunit C-terminal domain [Paludibacteraceae bacterium]